MLRRVKAKQDLANRKVATVAEAADWFGWSDQSATPAAAPPYYTNNGAQQAGPFTLRLANVW